MKSVGPHSWHSTRTQPCSYCAPLSTDDHVHNTVKTLQLPLFLPIVQKLPLLSAAEL